MITRLGPLPPWTLILLVMDKDLRQLNLGATALGLLDDSGVEVTILGSGLRGEGGGGLPLGGCAGGGLLHHLVDLLEGETLGLGDEEVRVDEGTGAEGTPDEEHGGLHVALVGVDHVGGDDGDDGVPEPVRGSGESDTTGSDGQREDLANDDPRTGSPGGGEEEDEDGDEGDLGVDGADVVSQHLLAFWVRGVEVSLVETDGHAHTSDDELADKHTEGTNDQDCAATESLDSPEGERSREDVDDGKDHGHKERVLDGTGGLEEGGRVVEDEVDTGPVFVLAMCILRRPPLVCDRAHFNQRHHRRGNLSLTIAASSAEKYRG